MSDRSVVRLDDLRSFSKGGGLIGPGFLMLQGHCVVANGCFDLLHPGHLAIIERLDQLAQNTGHYAVVAMNSDESVRALKGPGRPVMPEAHRAAMLTSLRWPLSVVIFDEETPQRLMDLLRPSHVVKGDQYPQDSVVRWEGSRVASVEMLPGWSTSGIIGRLNEEGSSRR